MKWEYKMVQPLWKTMGQCLKKLNKYLPCISAMPLQGIYPREISCTFVWFGHTMKCIQIFLIALFAVASN